MKLEQHLYTSGTPEFTTVAITKGLRREECLNLETHSLYILPTSLMYQDHVETPVKFVYYPLGKDRVVVGKAIYTGKDSLGRPGNYLFHNLIADKKDVLTFFQLNPVILLRYLESNNLFLGTVPQDPLVEVELTPETHITPTHISPHFRGDLLIHLLSVCLFHSSLQFPLLLNGTVSECLSFLEQLYPLLPYQLRTELSFDTYAYGVNLGFRIQSLPKQSEFRQNLSPSFMLNLSDLQYSSSFEMPAPSRRLTLMTEMISAEKLEDLNTMYLLEYYLEQNDYPKFRSKYSEVSQKIRAVILDFHRSALLDHIVEQHDIVLLRLLQEHIIVEDLAVLSSRPDLIELLLKSGETRDIRLFVEWLSVGDGEKSDCYPFLFEFPNVWNIFLERITSQPQDMRVLLEALKIFPRYYTPEYEDRLLTCLFAVLPSLVQDKHLSREFLKTLQTFPSPDALDLGLSRTTVLYALNQNSTLLIDLLHQDLSLLSGDRQQDVLNIILRGVFQKKNIEEIQQHVHRLLEKSLHNEDSLLMLLGVIEQIEFSKKVQIILKDLLTEIPQSKRSPDIDACIREILKPPPSFLKRLTGKILENL